MTRLFQTLRKTLLSTKHKLEQLYKNTHHHCIIGTISNGSNPIQTTTTVITRRGYITDMRKSAFEGKILRLLRNEIQHELDHSPPRQPATKFGEFMIDERPGEQWIRLKRKFAENEEIKVDVTMFDGAITVPKSQVSGPDDDLVLHITLVVNIQKGNNDVLEIVCSAWPDSIEITKLFVRNSRDMPAQAYVGPQFKELDDELQNSLYEYLEARGIDDEMAAFLHEYIHNKGKTEYIRWMGNVYSYIENK